VSKISVVILNWNRGADTVSALGSCLRQTCRDFEVVVWDNASDDGSADLIRRRFRNDRRVRVIDADANYGVAGGRNRAFPSTRGDIILSLDSDATVETTDAFDRIAERFEQDHLVGAMSFEHHRPDGHLMWPFRRPAAAWQTREFETIRLDGCAFAVRRSVFDRIGGFPEHFSPYGAEDQHFAINVIGIGCKVLYFPAVAIVHASVAHGRTNLQFRRHVRNSLWIPMEMFPFPHCAVSYARLAAGLFRESSEQRRVGEFVRGWAEATAGFRIGRRRPIDARAWRRNRALVAEDKSLAEQP
jgi:GT2 family glycosyltransferase